MPLRNEHLIPPGEMIVQNKIGSSNKKDFDAVREEFARVGDRMAAGLVKQGPITPTSHILDAGCGLGRVSRGFVDVIGSDGSYTGIDVVPSSIGWCQAAYLEYPNFRFIQADVYSKFYNPHGSTKAENFKLPFRTSSFDFIFSMSLFTHLLIDATDNYLAEMSRVAKLKTKLINTFFILDEGAKGRVKNFHEVTGGRVQDPEYPEAVSAIYLSELEAIHRKHSLEIVNVGFGTWSGRSDGKGYQDTIVSRRI
jgi:SAM-dependent methyltransferase